MSDRVNISDQRSQTVVGRARAFETIFFGGLTVGVLDEMFAFVFYGLILGVPTQRIFQSVAAGVLGRASFEGGDKTFVLGLALHFVVATCIALVYYLASLKLPVLVRRPVVCGLLYGLVAYLVMNYIVIPLSAANSGRFSLRVFLPAFIGHAFLVGLPVALIAHRSARGHARRAASA